MNHRQMRRRLACIPLTELHRLRRTCGRGKMLERVEAEAMLRELICRPEGNTTTIIKPSKLNYLQWVSTAKL